MRLLITCRAPRTIARLSDLHEEQRKPAISQVHMLGVRDKTPDKRDFYERRGFETKHLSSLGWTFASESATSLSQRKKPPDHVPGHHARLHV